MLNSLVLVVRCYATAVVLRYYYAPELGLVHFSLSSSDKRFGTTIHIQMHTPACTAILGIPWPSLITHWAKISKS
jgi:hypothetical protein